MHYEIDVAFNGNELFATHTRSIAWYQKAEYLYTLFSKKFPKEEGYEVTVSKYTTIKENVDFK